MSVASVEASTASFPEAGPGASPRAALHELLVRPIPHSVARHVIVQHHYLHSWPGGTFMSFGVFRGSNLAGVLTLGAGPANVHRLVEGACRWDSDTLTRMCLSDTLPPNAASRVLGVITRALGRPTDLKFLATYADPSQGHLGTIYQASNWLYTGLSDPTPAYELGDGTVHHPRSLAATYGTRSTQYLRSTGLAVNVREGVAKHRYVHFIEPTWRQRLLVPVLPYPKKEASQ